MNIIHYCKFCKRTAYAGKKDDVYYCTKCGAGDKEETIFSEEDNGPTLDELFDERQVINEEELTDLLESFME